MSLDVISQAELAEVADFQAAEWLAAQHTHKAVLRIMERLAIGATIEAGEQTFERELRMVRSRKKEGAG